MGDCARDLVGECRKCERVVCRVCVPKELWNVYFQIADIPHGYDGLCGHIV